MLEDVGRRTKDKGLWGHPLSSVFCPLSFPKLEHDGIISHPALSPQAEKRTFPRKPKNEPTAATSCGPPVWRAAILAAAAQERGPPKIARLRPSAHIWSFADAIWSTCSSWSFSNCGSVFTHGAAKKPFRRWGEMCCRTNATVEETLSSTLQLDGVGTWSNPAFSSSM